MSWDEVKMVLEKQLEATAPKTTEAAVLKKAIKAVELQIKMPPIYHVGEGRKIDGRYWSCRRCGFTHIVYQIRDFCPHCGQAAEWGNEG